jgi:hypothetical protein
MSHRLSRENNRRQQKQDYRNSTVKAAEFGFDPGIEVDFGITSDPIPFFEKTRPQDKGGYNARFRISCGPSYRT